MGNNIIDMFEALPTLMQIFWGCAILGSLFMIIQLILSLVGIGDTDIDFSGDSVDGLDTSGGMDLFTIKNITNFFVGFGWGGISFAPSIETEWLLIAIAIVCGCLFVLLFIFLFRQLMKIQSNGAMGIETSIGLTADVYLHIPAARSGKGKIQVSLGGASREFAAITDDTDDLPTGSTVVIVEKISEDTLLVSKK